MLLAFLIAAAPLQDRPALPDAGDDGTATRRAGCNPDDQSITVCGDPDQSRFRSRPIDGARWAGTPLRPTFQTPGGGQGIVQAEQRAVGATSAPALMVTVQIPLGAKPKKK